MTARESVEYFRAIKNTHRFNANQKVWIRNNYANFMEIWFKWRGSGRYVTGFIDKYSPCVGEIKSIDVDHDFAMRIGGNHE